MNTLFSAAFRASGDFDSLQSFHRSNADVTKLDDLGFTAINVSG